MPQRKLQNIDFIPGTNGLTNIRVGEGVERAQQVELETQALENIL